MLQKKLKSFLKNSLSLLLILAASLLLSFCNLKLNASSYLSFSDGAKFALVAKNLLLGNGFTTDFSFFGQRVFSEASTGTFQATGISPLAAYSILPFLKVFGINDAAIIYSSAFFFVLLIITIFLLGKKLFGGLVGALSALAVAANLNFIDYATSGASEPLFAFLIVLAAYFLILRKGWATVASFLAMAAMYFSRPQAVIFIAGLILLWLILQFGLKKAFIYFFGLGALGYLVDKLIIYPLSFKYPLTPVFVRGIQGIFTYSSNTAVSDALRGAPSSTLGVSDVLKKTFYNLYNFYKLLPQIASPYMWALFVIGLFVWTKDRLQNSLKLATIFIVVVTFLVTALTIPFFRYLHPVIPLVYLFATATLVWVIKQIIIIDWKLEIRKLRPLRGWKFKIEREKSVVLVSALLIFVFVVGQTLGVIFLDSRFKAKQVNKGQPPVYVRLSWLLRDITEPDDVIVTNLDTWGSWYGERKTVWFPLKPDMLIPSEEKTDPFDAIYLTSYLIDDENYYMGDEWRQIFKNPENPENQFIKDNYTLKGIYEIPASETYEKKDARAVLLVKKEDI